jgi:hypothetical protein
MGSPQPDAADTLRLRKPIVDLMLLGALCIVVSILASRYDLLKPVIDFAQRHELWELDECIAVGLFLVPALAVFACRRWKDALAALDGLSQRNQELHEMLSEISKLRGILPICASCKKIRDDEGFWHQVEAYIGNHSQAEFTHGICPECMHRLYPDFIRKRKKKRP